MEENMTVKPNQDGTVNLVHYGTTYRHFWVAEVKKIRGRLVATIYGKKGGKAMIVISKGEAADLMEARAKAQEAATLDDVEIASKPHLQVLDHEPDNPPMSESEMYRNREG